MVILPSILELFQHSSAAFVEAGVADFSFVGKDFSPGLVYGFLHGFSGSARKALIPLAMVISTDIKVVVVVPVIPLDEFRTSVFRIIFQSAGRLLLFFRMLHLGKKPASGDDRMSFEQVLVGSRTHL